MENTVDEYSVSAVVLNWNGLRFLEPCLSSLEKQTCPSLEIILVDNGSADGSVEHARRRHPRVRIIENKRNLGYGAGNNAGIAACRGEFVAVVNNDAELDEKCIEEMVRVLRSCPEAGACAARIMLKGGEDRVDAAGIAVCPDGLAIGRGRMEPAAGYLKQEEVFFASGCCALFRRKMLEDVGPYDEDFFAYADDTDLGWRARCRGWTSVYAPAAVVFHHHSGSSGGFSPFKVYHVERNRICVMMKNFPWTLVVLSVFFTGARYFWQAVGALSRKGRAGRFRSAFSFPRLVRETIRAYGGAFRLAPAMLKKRWEIRSGKRIRDPEYRRLIRRFGISAKGIALKE